MTSPLVDDLKLNDVERDAKAYVMRVVTEGSNRPCDSGTSDAIDELENTLPTWYDPVAYKRGQQYFQHNRFGVLSSNMAGLITLLAEPKGLKLLASTGRSSTSASAQHRYVSTIRHLLFWYDIDLTPGSKSWQSLQRVRKMHLQASNTGVAKGIGAITQMEVALTTFGFMGFVLIRPHLLGIRYDNTADREAFVHFWAVMGHQLGVSDEYNMCLLRLPVVEEVCRALLRFVFIPLIQLESPEFKRMVQAMLDGMSHFLPFMRYDMQMFLVRRLCGVPGYQYNVDMSKEVLVRELFTPAEKHDMRQHIFRHMGHELSELAFDTGVPLIEVQRRAQGDRQQTADDNEDIAQMRSVVRKILELNDLDDVHIRFMNPDKDGGAGWSAELNDAKFYELSERDQYVVRRRVRIIRLYGEWRIIRFLCETGLSVVLYMMDRWSGSKAATATLPAG